MKPTREEIEQQLLAYAEGTLPPAEAARAEVYLANTDPKLGVQVLGMAADRQALQGLPKLRAPHDLAERIMEQVERNSLLGNPEREHRGARRWFQVRYAAAAAIFLLAGTFTYVIVKMVSTEDNGWHQHGPIAMKPDEPKTAPDGGTSPIITAGDSNRRGGELAVAGKGGQVPATIAGRGSTDALGVDGPVTEDKRGAAGEPVTLTLVAKNADDEARLRTLLASFVADDQAESASVLKDSSDYAAKAPTAMNGSLEATQRGGGVGGDLRSAPAAPAPQRDAQTHDLALQYQPQQQVTQQMPSPSDHGQAVAENKKLDAVEQQAAPGGARYYQEAVVAGMKKGVQHSKAGPAPQVMFVGTAGAPYHVRLRREQLATLTTQFTVASASAGILPGQTHDMARSVNQINPSDAWSSARNSKDGTQYNYEKDVAGNLPNSSNSLNNAPQANMSSNAKPATEADANGLPNPQNNGTITFNGANTYAGGTTISGGTIPLNGAASNTTSGSITGSGTVPLGSATQPLAAPQAFAPVVPPNHVGTPTTALAAQAAPAFYGTASQNDREKLARQLEQVSAGGYVDCIITLLPPPPSSAK